MSNTKINIYQGNQIGGCVVSIETEKAKICIDLGENLPGKEKVEKLEIEGLTIPGNRQYDAIFFTHYHGDHVGRIKDVKEGIKMYMGETAKKVLFTINETVKNTEMCELLQNKVKTFYQNKPITFGDLTITPYLVDHSAYDAYMFLIETPDRKILHTGDFRLHGYRGKATIPVIKSLIKDFERRKIDILITEGTMLSRKDEKYYKEGDMLRDAIQLMRKHKYVFLICSSTNLDSLATFYQAGQNQYPARKMYSNYYVFNQLKNFSETAGQECDLYNFKNIEIVDFERKSYKSNGEIITQEERMKMFGFVTVIKWTDYYEKWIERFRDCEEKPIVIYSMWDGYRKKRNPAYNEELAKFCKKYNAMPMHTSGHIYPKDLEEVINTICPREAIIPIHTEYAEGIKSLNLKHGLKRKIKLNVSEYICKTREDSRRVSEQMLGELKNGRFCEFVKFIKQNPDKELALCFRGNNKENGIESAIVYYNNHKVWELTKEDTDFKVKISFNHARYTKNWKEQLEKLCNEYQFTYQQVNRKDEKKIDINNAINKIDDKNQYSIGYLINKNRKYDRSFVEGTFEILISVIEDFFNKDKKKDYFKSYYERKNIKNEKKHEYIEKKRQQKLYLELNNSENGLYIYDLEFAQKMMAFYESGGNKNNKKEAKNQPDMHAIRFKDSKPESFVMVEVKSTESAMKDRKSGLKKHLEGMEKYVKDHKELVQNRLKEAFNILSQYQDLGLRKLKRFDKENDLELYTSLKKIEIRFILTDEAAKYYRRNKAYFKEGNEKRLEEYLRRKHYEIEDNEEENRIEIWKEIIID